MANTRETGSRPNASSGNTPRTSPTGTAVSEVDAVSGRAIVYDTDGTTTPTGTAAATPGTWRTAEDDGTPRVTSSLGHDPVPATRSGASMMATLIALIVIVLIAYFVWQFLF